MACKAYFETRRGGSGVRPLRSQAEVEMILQGGYGVTTVRIENDQGDVIGQRERLEGGADDRRIRWNWSYDKEAVRAALGQ